MKKTIGIKVDVDTFWGMREGVPSLIALFGRTGVSASFFVPMGRDHTGRTVKRVFRKGFLRKAGRVGVVEAYGIRTLLYGLVLPGPQIARSHRSLLARIKEEGHELGIHGLDHVFWHDKIRALSVERTARELDRAVTEYRELVGEMPRAFAAPGWNISAFAVEYMERARFLYTSNVRGRFPFYPEIEGRQFALLEIPSTLPTLDEVVGRKGTEPKELAQYFLSRLGENLEILTVHTELEGRRWGLFLETFITGALERGYVFSRLSDIAQTVISERSARPGRIDFGEIEGRAGEVCLQTP